jgi:hypothetical protein
MLLMLLLATHWPPNADGDSTDPIRAQSANKDKNLADDFAARCKDRSREISSRSAAELYCKVAITFPCDDLVLKRTRSNQPEARQYAPIASDARVRSARPVTATMITHSVGGPSLGWRLRHLF